MVLKGLTIALCFDLCSLHLCLKIWIFDFCLHFLPDETLPFALDGRIWRGRRAFRIAGGLDGDTEEGDDVWVSQARKNRSLALKFVECFHALVRAQVPEGQVAEELLDRH